MQNEISTAQVPFKERKSMCTGLSSWGEYQMRFAAWTNSNKTKQQKQRKNQEKN